MFGLGYDFNVSLSCGGGDLLLIHVQLLDTTLSHVPRTEASQAPLSMGFLKQEYWSGLPFPSPGDLSNPRIDPKSPALRADS